MSLLEDAIDAIGDSNQPRRAPRPPGAAHLRSMSIRHIHNQPARDDYVEHPDLGVATVRTDHPNGTSTFRIQVAVDGYRGLHLDTGTAITQTGSRFSVNLPGPHPIHPSLQAALAAAAPRPIHLPVAFAA